MEKLRTISRCFRVLFLIIMIALPILYVLYWMNAPYPITFGLQNFSLQQLPLSLLRMVQLPLSMQARVAGFVVSLIPLTMHLLILYFLIRLFSLYGRGEIFTLKNVKYIRCIGYTMLIGELLNFVYQALMSLVLTWNSLIGFRVAHISITNSTLAVLFASVLIIMISWIMAEGCRLQEEQKYTI